MIFRLTATSVPYTTHDDSDIEVKYLKEYFDKIKNKSPLLDLPDPFVKDNHVYIDLTYGSHFFKLAEVLDEELIVRNQKEPVIEIYDSWRE